MSLIVKVIAPLIVIAYLFTTSAEAATHKILLKDSPPYTVPTDLEIAVGDTVVWQNEGPNLDHVVADENVELHSKDIPVGKIWEHTFSKAGIYSYLCLRHFFMRGRVVVRNLDGSLTRDLDFPYQAAFKAFNVPTENSVPRMIISDKSTGDIWFTEGGGGFYGFEDVPPQNKIGKLDTYGRIIEYSAPAGDKQTGVAVDSLVMDRKGNIWFTERLAGKVGKLDRTGNITEFPLSSPKSEPLGIDVDRNGNIWVALRFANKLVRISPDGVQSEVELPEPDSEPRTVFVDSRDRVWYTARVANEIGYYDTSTKKITRLEIPTKNARPAGICETSGGEIYFVEMVGNKIAKVVGKQIVEFSIPTKFSGAFKVIADKENNLWFTQVISNAIARFDTSTFEFMEFKIPTEDSRPGGIAIDSKGFIWFTQQKGNKIGMLDPTKAIELYRASAPPATDKRSFLKKENNPHPGHAQPDSIEIRIEDYPVPTSFSSPGNSIVEDDRQWLWFTQVHGNKIGAINIRSKEFKEFPLLTPASLPVGLARDRDGMLWATQFRGNSLARLDPVSGRLAEFKIPFESALPAGIAIDETNEVWVTLLGRNAISRFDRDLKKFENYELPRPESGPLQVIADLKGALWITASEERGNYLARFDLRKRTFEAFDLPTKNASPVGLLSDGFIIWVAEGGVAKLAKFHTGTKTWEEFQMPNEQSEPVKLAKDLAGNIWVTDGGGLGGFGGNAIWIFSPSQETFKYASLKNPRAKPMGITIASDGHVWFTQQGANTISRVVGG